MKIIATTVLVLAPTAFAQHRVFDVDPEASAVNCSLGDVLHSVHGTFRVHRAFCEVSFVPGGYQGTINAEGDSAIQITGMFILHGTAHELTVPIQIHIAGTVCTAKAHFMVP